MIEGRETLLERRGDELAKSLAESVDATEKLRKTNKNLRRANKRLRERLIERCETIGTLVTERNRALSLLADAVAYCEDYFGSKTLGLVCTNTSGFNLNDARALLGVAASPDPS